MAYKLGVLVIEYSKSFVNTHSSFVNRYQTYTHDRTHKHACARTAVISTRVSIED